MECYLCHDTFEEKRLYCVDCQKSIWEVNKADILERKRRLQLLSEENESVRKFVTEVLEKQYDKRKEIFELQTRSLRISELKEKIQTLQQKIQQGKEGVEKIRQAQKEDELSQETVKKKMEENTKVLVDTYSNQRIEIQKLHDNSTSIQKSVSLQRRTLVSELLSFFTIAPSPSLVNRDAGENDCMVINIILPNSGRYTGLPSDVISAALGYVVHIVGLLSTYLGIVLPYKMMFMGSRSIIWSEGVVPAEPKRYQLHYQGYSPTRDFETGVKMLNENIAFLCYAQGVKVSKKNIPCTLPNLLALFRSPTLGEILPHALLTNSIRTRNPKTVKVIPPTPNPTTNTTNTIQTSPTPPTTPTTPVKETSSLIIDINTANSPHTTTSTPTATPPPPTTILSEDDEEWEVVHNLPLPPAPHQTEDLAQFERAMFIDIT
eukprot:TRINITY_DN4132_c0_g1_i2.p1 TRINITY_DN4132_c0_g1~~TRINITY_DN4132_c0_g1_i2.p1  ORF type:complete len:433 (-),score=99.62 TRINITY_DN4132_c0_g1_i2:86-1384(-)